jgi:hypothetical protein
LKIGSFPELLCAEQSGETLFEFILEKWPRNTNFVDISKSDWENDYDFLKSYKVIKDFLSKSSSSEKIVIPKQILVDCFALLFLSAEQGFVFEFEYVLEKLMVISISIEHENGFLLFLNCLIIHHLKMYLFLKMITAVRNLFRVKDFQISVFVRSALFQIALFSERSPSNVTFGDLERHLIEVPVSQQLFCKLDFLCPYRRSFSLPIDSFRLIFERLCNITQSFTTN